MIELDQHDFVGMGEEKAAFELVNGDYSPIHECEDIKGPSVYIKVVGTPLAERDIVAREAMEMAIAKWQFIYSALQWLPNDVTIRDGAVATCGLCAFYGVRCQGCPIYEETGILWCEDTPFIDWIESSTREEYITSSREMIEFLKKIEKGNSKSKYTPGPWAVEYSERPLEIQAGHKPIAIVKGRGGNEEEYANARLIAAAPDLLMIMRALYGIIYHIPSLRREWAYLMERANVIMEEIYGGTKTNV